MSRAPSLPLARVRADLAPQGQLRAAINLGNPALARRNPLNDELFGISVDLAQALAEELAVPFALVEYQAAGTLVAALNHQAWDIGFLAIDQQRQAQLAFSRPYLEIQGQYLVRKNSPIWQLADVDQPGVCIAVSAGSAYEGFLSTHLRAAQLARFTTSVHALAAFKQQQLPVLAGVSEVVHDFAAQDGALRVIDTPFMSIAQAMATPIGRDVGAAYITDFITRQLNNGFVAASLKRNKAINTGPVS